MAPHTLLLLLALVTCASGSHFGGSIMTFYPKEQSNESIEVDLRFKRSNLGSCSLSNRWFCSNGNCGDILSSEVEEVFDGNEACQSEGVSRMNLSSNKPFTMRFSKCCWSENVHNGSNRWNLTTYVDLGIRSDTGAPNRPPLTTTLPVVSLAKNCPQAIQLLHHDQDGDQVRCRFAGIDECEVCAPHENFHLDEETCRLHYVGDAEIGTHVFEIVMEDFPRGEITLSYTDGSETVRQPLSSNSAATPISKLNFGFAIIVKQDLLNCTEGVFRPALIAPSPQYGDTFKIPVEETLEITIAAETLLAQLSDIVLSGPTGISRSPGSQGDMIIKWTPTEREAYDHFPICFSAESLAGDDYYQSDMRCIIVEVRPKLGEMNVVCTQTTMTIVAERSYVPGLEVEDISLLDSSCKVSMNDTHVYATVDLDGCGTEAEENSDNVTFSNALVKVEDAMNIITRTDDSSIQFSCTYPKEEIVVGSFKALQLSKVYKEDNFGKFSFDFEFFHSIHYAEKVDTSSSPYEVRLSEMIFMEIKSTSSLKNTVLFVESCKATPDDNPNHMTFYSLIENGCVVEETMEAHKPQSNEFRFQMRAFKFIGMHNEVYITCSVMLCLADDPDTRCAQGCIRAPSRVKRSVAGQTARHSIIQGPLRLKRSDDDDEEDNEGVSSAPSVAINLNILAGTVLAALALVCGVVVYKIKKSSEIRYTQLPQVCTE